MNAVFYGYAGCIVDHALAAIVRGVLAGGGAGASGGAGFVGAGDTVSARLLGGGGSVAVDQVRGDAAGPVARGQRGGG